MNALILAGGLGTRLKSISGNLPKALIPIDGKPFVDFQMELLISQGVEKFVFALGYKAEQLINHLEKKYNNVYFSVENKPLGTGGAIKNALNNFSYLFNDKFIVINGDTLVDFSLSDLTILHGKNSNDITLLLVEVSDVSRYGAVRLQATRVTGFNEKNCRGRGLINGGVYLISPSVITKMKYTGAFSFEKEILPDLSTYRVGGLPLMDKKFIDIGTPESYSELDKKVRELDNWK